jgi:hypothetical protein
MCKGVEETQGATGPERSAPGPGNKLTVTSTPLCSNAKTLCCQVSISVATLEGSRFADEKLNPEHYLKLHGRIR